MATSSDSAQLLPDADPSANAPAGDVTPSASVTAPIHAASALELTAQDRRGWLLSPPVMALRGFVLICFALAFAGLAAPILTPILLAVFIVTLTLPAYRWLAARKIKKGLVLAAIMLGVLVIGVGIALLVWLSVTSLMAGLETYSANIEAFFQEVAAWFQSLGVDLSGLADAVANAVNELLKALLYGIAEAASQFGLAAVLAAFLLLEAPRLRRLLESSMRDLPYIGMTPQVMKVAVQYFFIRFRLNIVTGTLFGLTLWVLGIDYAFLWGVLTVFLSFVPYVGLVLAAIPATLLALAEYGLGRAIVVIVAVLIINLVVENVIAPSYTGKTLRLSAAVVFVSFLFWAWLLGPIGALLAMPITVLLMLTFGRYESTRWIAQLIGDTGPQTT